MAKFHLNPTTGEPGKCSAEQGNCPFSSADDHFDSAEDAREVAEELYGGFDRWNIPTEEQDGALAVKLYPDYLMNVEYDDFSYAQAGQMAKYMATNDESFTVTEDSRYDATIHFKKEEGEKELEIRIYAKRNRVSHEIFIDGESVRETDPDDVDNGEAMFNYIEHTLNEAYDLREDYNDK